MTALTGQVDDYNDQNQDQAHYLSISMGLASKRGNEENFDEILHQADQQMYQVKNKKNADLNAHVMESLKRVLYNKLPDREKKGQRWRDLSQKMGQAIGLSEADLKRLELLSTLGDVGKITTQETSLINDNPLLKSDEKECRCPEDGYRIAKAIPDLSGIAECILAHEEKWDGSGYPRGLKDEEIPLLARIRSLAVFCEEFEAEEEKEWQKAEKIAALKEAASLKYDPNLLNVFINIL